MDTKKERAILVGLNCPTLPSTLAVTDTTLDELEELFHTAGGEVLARVIQNRISPEPKTFLGTGKAKEVGELAEKDVYKRQLKINKHQCAMLFKNQVHNPCLLYTSRIRDLLN